MLPNANIKFRLVTVTWFANNVEPLYSVANETAYQAKWRIVI